jgi:hypothetical protein
MDYELAKAGTAVAIAPERKPGRQQLPPTPAALEPEALERLAHGFADRYATLTKGEFTDRLADWDSFRQQLLVAAQEELENIWRQAPRRETALLLDYVSLRLKESLLPSHAQSGRFGRIKLRALGVRKGPKNGDQRVQRGATAGPQWQMPPEPPVRQTARAQEGGRRRVGVGDPVVARQRAYRRRLQARVSEQAAAWRLERATDRAVLRLRKQGWTLARIGAALGVSRQRVHQIERRARRLLAKR